MAASSIKKHVDFNCKCKSVKTTWSHMFLVYFIHQPLKALYNLCHDACMLSQGHFELLDVVQMHVSINNIISTGSDRIALITAYETTQPLKLFTTSLP